MDELKIVTGFSKKLLAHWMERWIRKKLKYDVEINLNELDATITEEKAKVHLSIDVEVGDGELKRLLEKLAGDKPEH